MSAQEEAKQRCRKCGNCEWWKFTSKIGIGPEGRSNGTCHAGKPGLGKVKFPTTKDDDFCPKFSSTV